MKYAVFFFLVVVSSVHPTISLACSPLPSDSSYMGASITSLRPANNPPKGGIQLKIGVINREQVIQDYSNLGKVALPVKEVLTGQFSGSTILLNTTNVDDCSSTFGTPIGESYITVLPMVYSDGEPVLDRKGTQEFGAIFYKDKFSHYTKHNKAQKFGEYSEHQFYSFLDVERHKCLNRKRGMNTGLTDEIYQRCVAPGEYLSLDCDNSKAGKLVCQEVEIDKLPFDLRRGYSFWGAYGATIATMLLVFASMIGISLFAKGTKRYHD